MVFWNICKTRIDFEMVVATVKTHLSLQKVHILGVFVTLISVDTTYNSEHQAITYDVQVKFNCDCTSFTANISWIAQDGIVILFRLKNLL